MNNYIDTHSHILFGIDDGATTINDSIRILKSLKNAGFSKVILTPHYRGSFTSNNAEKERLLAELKKECNDNKIDIELFLANEVRITSRIEKLIEEEKIKLLGNYLFLELPFKDRIVNLDRIIYSLQKDNINIIIVHPERYDYYSKKDYKELLEKDIIYQVNYGSLLGKYGFRAKRIAKYLIKNRMVTFLGTDIHSEDDKLNKKIEKIRSKIIKMTDIDYYNDITYNNINEIIEEITD